MWGAGSSRTNHISMYDRECKQTCLSRLRLFPLSFFLVESLVFPSLSKKVFQLMIRVLDQRQLTIILYSYGLP